jgi:hypothetical protein
MTKETLQQELIQLIKDLKYDTMIEKMFEAGSYGNNLHCFDRDEEGR